MDLTHRVQEEEKKSINDEEVLFLVDINLTRNNNLLIH